MKSTPKVGMLLAIALLWAGASWAGLFPIIEVSTTAQLTNGVRNALVNSTIRVLPGTYNIGTNQLCLKEGVKLLGSGIGRTIIAGCADGYGVEELFSPTGGSQIVCSNNCELGNFTIIPDTNTIITRATATPQTHSGLWYAIGCSQLNPPNTTSATNVYVHDVQFDSQWLECVHINNPTTPDSYTFERCQLVSAWGIIQTATAASSLFRFISCNLTNPNVAVPTTGGYDGIFDTDGGSLAVSLAQASGGGKMVFDNCIGVQNQTPDNVPLGLFYSADGTARYEILGGSWSNRNSTIEFTRAYTSGYGRFNGTFSSTSGPTNFTAYAIGTAYTLTGSSTALTFGTTQPVLTINQAGTYKITGKVGLKYSGATYASAQTVTFKFRRTNNTAADLANGSRAVEMPFLVAGAAFTGGDVMPLPDIVYTAASGDTVTIFGILSATPPAGSVQADSAELMADRIY